MRANIVKWGNSQGLRFPKSLLDLVNFAENEPVEIIAKDDVLIIKKISPVKRRKSIVELFEGYTEDYDMVEYDWGQPKGEEVW